LKWLETPAYIGILSLAGKGYYQWDKAKMGQSILQIAYYPSLLETRGRMLEKDGYAVTSVLGNDQGMAVASAGRFDVIVVGFSAPHSMRTNMVRWLKQNISEVPVVVLLAHSHEDFPDADLTTLSENPLTWLAAVRKASTRTSN
jgi:CheY-like chemotaxis protein